MSSLKAEYTSFLQRIEARVKMYYFIFLLLIIEWCKNIVIKCTVPYSFKITQIKKKNIRGMGHVNILTLNNLYM